MTASIIEYSNRTTHIVVTEQDGERHVFDIMENDSQEELGLIDYELFHGHAVFNYSLLGDPNTDVEEISDVHDYGDEYA